MAKAKSTFVTRFRQTPLSVQLILEPVGEIPVIQSYDPVAGHVPDYGVSPLIIRPRLMVDDPDGWQTTEAGVIEPGWKWEWLDDDGTWKTATADTTGATGIHLTGAAPWPTAQISVQSNTLSGTVRTLRLTCQYKDTRSGGVYVVSQAIGLKCNSEAPASPRLTLSRGRGVVYNPMADEPVIAVVATLSALGREMPMSEYGTTWGVEWQVRDDSGVWVDYDEDDPRMVFMAPDGETLSLRLNLCRDGTLVRCLGWYRGEDGSVLGVADPTHTTFTPEATLAVRRTMAAMDVEIQECAREVTPRATAVSALAVISDGKRGIVTGPLRHARLTWTVGSGAGAHTVTETERVTIPLTQAGAECGVEAADRGADRVVKAGGATLMYNGKILITPNP